MPHFKGSKIWRASSLAFLLLFFSLSSVQAIEYGSFGGRPAFPREDNPRTESIFVHTLSPGSTQDEGVMVVNNAPETKTLIVYGADSTPSTGGAFACKQLSEAKTDVGAWIDLEQTEITLEPGTNQVIPFTIQVPDSASVGEHNGCILIQEKKEVSDQAGVNLSIRTGLRVAITIPGAITRKLELAGFTVTSKDSGFLLHPLVKNTGNVSIDAEVAVVTRNLFGVKIFTHGGQYPILRGETSDWNFELKKPFWGGWYRSSFTVDYDQNAEATVGVNSGKELTKLAGDTIWFFSMPTALGLIIEILILVLILAGLIWWKLSQKKKKWIKANWQDYMVAAGDDINALAARLNVSWKLLAKVNKLKAPYALKSGEKIKVPPAK